jgi:hypothetical protein
MEVRLSVARMVLSQTAQVIGGSSPFFGGTIPYPTASTVPRLSPNRASRRLFGSSSPRTTMPTLALHPTASSRCRDLQLTDAPTSIPPCIAHSIVGGLGVGDDAVADRAANASQKSPDDDRAGRAAAARSPPVATAARTGAGSRP